MERIVTKEDYIQSLKDVHHVLYYNGRRVDDVTEHPALRPHVNAAACT
jgi:4-hydroxybutyryl-CoA dehydratase/vinylacetyl-CoA-Delta-isomerase